MYGRKLLLAGIATLLPVMAAAADLSALIRGGQRVEALAAIRGGSDVNTLQADASSPLLWAVHAVDRELVRELLARGAKPSQRNVLGATPLVEALESGDTDIVSMLLKAGADPNLGNDDDETPLMIAARAGSLPMVQQLVQAGAKVRTREKFRQQSALMWGVYAGSGPVTEFLIRHGAVVDERAASVDWGNQITSEPRAQYRATGGLTPLLFATRSGCLDCVKALLKAGADINRPTPEGVTPLMNAIDNTKYDVANYLLDQGANPHLADWWSRTALYLAIDMNTRAGAGGGAGGPGGRAAAAAAARADDGAAASRYSALQLAQRLLEMGVERNPQLNMHRPFRGRFTDDLITTGCTPMLRAAISVDRDAIALLLKYGAQPDLPNVMGVTPLMAAAGMGQGIASSSEGMRPRGADPQGDSIAVIQMLLKAGADVNARIFDTSSHTAVIARPSSMTDREGQTAMFGAIGRSWTRVAKFLIDNGAKLDVKDKVGKGVLDAIDNKAGGRDQPISDDMKALIRAATKAS
jgi:ankyrin repeat protein